MATVVKVVPKALNAMGDRFADRATQIETIQKNLNVNITAIQNGAFKGHVGDNALDKFANEFALRMQTLQSKLDEIGEDLKQTVTDYIREDEEAGTYFTGGGGGGGAR